MVQQEHGGLLLRRRSRAVSDTAFTVRSAVVPTEYDVEVNGRRVLVSDDHGRKFTARSLKRALRKAERAQDPSDPIHYPPFGRPA